MCGVIGVIGTKNSGYRTAVQESYSGLLKLQHRGQDAAGLMFVDEINSVRLHKQMGLISEVLSSADIQSAQSAMCIGHTRYATTGSNDSSNLQPMVLRQPVTVGMAHNGNLVNYHELARHWLKEHGSLSSTNDVELLLKLWCSAYGTEALDESFSFDNAVRSTKKVLETVDGAYAVVGLIPKYGLIAFRDPKGIRPLVIGKKEDEAGVRYCVTSETTALQIIGFEFVRDVKPAELIWIDIQGNIKSAICTSASRSSCMFEWVYFAGADSIIENKSVYTSRLSLGKRLATKVQKMMHSSGWRPDIVCPVPDTSRPSTIALAEELKVPYREVFIKNRYVQRSFILNTQEARERAVQAKLSPIVSEIKGRNILLVDDSIVRGTTSKNIVRMLRKHGAKSVAFGITCPPLRHPCFYGIDFPSSKELVASGKTIDQIADWIGVDHLVYLDEFDLMDAIDNKICMGCINGCYPTERKGYQEFSKHRRGYDTI